MKDWVTFLGEMCIFMEEEEGNVKFDTKFRNL